MKDNLNGLTGIGGLFIVIGIIGPFITVIDIGLAGGVICILIGFFLLAIGSYDSNRTSYWNFYAGPISTFSGMDHQRVIECLQNGDEGIKEIVHCYVDRHYYDEWGAWDTLRRHQELVDAVFMGMESNIIRTAEKYYYEYVEQKQKEKK